MDENQDQVDETPEEEQEVPEPKAEGAEDTSAKARTTKQFDKLKQSNQELKEEREAAKAEAEKYKQLYESYEQPVNTPPPAQEYQNLSQEQVNQAFQSMVDENGYLDGVKLANALNNLDQRAKAAEERAKIAEDNAKIAQKTAFESKQAEQAQKVYAKYPWLDPNNTEGVEVEGNVVKFDPDLWKIVYNELAVKAKQGQMPTNEDYMQAADYAAKFYNKPVNKQEQAEKVEDQKRNINAVRPRSPIMAGYYQSDSDEVLDRAVQMGKKGAVAEALKRHEEANAQ